MEDDKKEDWRKLCEEAAKEQDPDKLLLARQIIAMLDERLTMKRALKT